MLIPPQHFPAILAGISCASRGPLPILEHVLVRPTAGGASFTTTDLEKQVTATIPEVSGPLDGFCIHADKLRSILKSCPSGLPLEITPTDARATLRAGRSRWTLSTLPVSEFPSLPTATGGTSLAVPTADLRLGLSSVLDAAGRNDVRYYLNGVSFEIGAGALCLVATDGHRLHTWAISGVPPDISAQGILPRGSAERLARLATADNIRVDLTPSAATFAAGGIAITTKLVAAKYPDWRRVVPKTAHALRIDREELLAAISRCLILANEAFHGVTLTAAEGDLTVTSRSDTGDAVDIVALEDYGPDLTVGVNGPYLMDALEIFGTQHIAIGYIDGQTGLVLTPPGADLPLAVIMPTL